MSPVKLHEKKDERSAPSWMLRGKQAAQALRDEESRRASFQGNQMFRFYLQAGEQNVEISFLDGNLFEDGPEKGMIDTIAVYEHTVQTGMKKWDNFVCTLDVEGNCPICSAGINRSLVHLFTVIDHRTIQTQRGPKIDEPKLFVAKPQTMAKLQSRATRREGLRGCRFAVSRSGKQAPRVGDDFEFLEKLEDAELIGKYGDPAKTPTDYEKECPYIPAKQLLEQGIAGVVAGSSGEEEEDSDSGDLPF